MSDREGWIALGVIYVIMLVLAAIFVPLTWGALVVILFAGYFVYMFYALFRGRWGGHP